MIWLIVVLAQGWTISSPSLENRSTLMTILLGYSILHVLLFMFTYRRNPSTVYKYATTPGICIVVLRVVVWVWFLRSLFQTIKKEFDDQKRLLYLGLLGMFTVWLLALPVLVLVASSVVPCRRKGLVASLALAADVANLSVLAFLLWPSRASLYFQIAIPSEFAPIKREDL
eukprot:c19625_g1_i6.p1 GENE.c19625_g1_i6~~c19625_g1_i6.p1  ORF type:complete len:171 (+),score=34.33 c19625_g1_i6:172-684(+)